MSAIVGVWVGSGSGMLAEVQPSVPLLLVTLRRCKAAAFAVYCLIPWASELDHLAHEVKAWGFQARRTHPDKRIAMRDALCEILDKNFVGVLVEGEAAAIDPAEIKLARARLENGWEEYLSPRITAYTLERWLRVSDTDEWPSVMGVEQAKRFYVGHSLEGPSRALAARMAERPKND